MGVFEFEKFAKGTFGVADTLAGACAGMQDGALIIMQLARVFGAATANEGSCLID